MLLIKCKDADCKFKHTRDITDCYCQYGGFTMDEGKENCAIEELMENNEKEIQKFRKLRAE